MCRKDGAINTNGLDYKLRKLVRDLTPAIFSRDVQYSVLFKVSLYKMESSNSLEGEEELAEDGFDFFPSICHQN